MHARVLLLLCTHMLGMRAHACACAAGSPTCVARVDYGLRCHAYFPQVPINATTGARQCNHRHKPCGYICGTSRGQQQWQKASSGDSAPCRINYAASNTGSHMLCLPHPAHLLRLPTRLLHPHTNLTQRTCSGSPPACSIPTLTSPSAPAQAPHPPAPSLRTQRTCSGPSPSGCS